MYVITRRQFAENTQHFSVHCSIYIAYGLSDGVREMSCCRDLFDIFDWPANNGSFTMCALTVLKRKSPNFISKNPKNTFLFSF